MATLRRSPLPSRFRTLKPRPPVRLTWVTLTKTCLESGILRSPSGGTSAAWTFTEKRIVWAGRAAWFSWALLLTSGFLTQKRPTARPRSALVTSRSLNNTTGRRSKCSRRTPSESLRLRTTNSGLTMLLLGTSTRPFIITANRFAIAKSCKIPSAPASHASTQRSRAPTRAGSPRLATGLNPPCAITNLARTRMHRSSRPSNSWSRSNLVSQRLHRRRKHIHADHIDQLDPQQERFHAGLLSARLQILQRPAQFLLILVRDVLHQRQAIRR